MTNYQAVSRRSSEEFDIREWSGYNPPNPPTTSPCPFGCVLKDCVAVNLPSTPAVPEEAGHFPIKVTFCHFGGGQWVMPFVACVCVFGGRGGSTVGEVRLCVCVLWG